MTNNPIHDHSFCGKTLNIKITDSGPASLQPARCVQREWQVTASFFKYTDYFSMHKYLLEMNNYRQNTESKNLRLLVQ